MDALCGLQGGGGVRAVILQQRRGDTAAHTANITQK